MTANFAKTVNAVGIGSSAWLERPALKLNKIRDFASRKINQNTSLQETAFLSYSNHRRASNPTSKTNMSQLKKQVEAALRGEQSIPRYLIHQFAKESKTEAKPIIEKFEALVKAGSHTEMYVGRPADWTFIPRSAAFSGTSKDSPELAALKESLKKQEAK